MAVLGESDAAETAGSLEEAGVGVDGLAGVLEHLAVQDGRHSREFQVRLMDWRIEYRTTPTHNRVVNQNTNQLHFKMKRSTEFWAEQN